MFEQLFKDMSKAQDVILRIFENGEVPDMSEQEHHYMLAVVNMMADTLSDLEVEVDSLEDALIQLGQ